MKTGLAAMIDGRNLGDVGKIDTRFYTKLAESKKGKYYQRAENCLSHKLIFRKIRTFFEASQ